MSTLHDLAALGQIMSAKTTAISSGVVVAPQRLLGSRGEIDGARRSSGKSKAPKPSSSSSSSSSGSGRTPYQFPWKLHQLLSDAEENNDEHILSWLPGGMAFQIHDKPAFIKKYMPTYFNTQTYKSFHRSLNLWGFQSLKRGNTPHGMNMIRMLTAIKNSNSGNGTVRSGKGNNPITTVGAYFHPLFVRGSPQLCTQMRRVNKNGSSMAPTTVMKPSTETTGNGETIVAPTPSSSATTTTIITPSSSTTSSVVSSCTGSSGSGSTTASSINKERCKAAIAGCGGDVSSSSSKKVNSKPTSTIVVPSPDIQSSSSKAMVDSMLLTKMMIEKSKQQRYHRNSHMVS